MGVSLNSSPTIITSGSGNARPPSGGGPPYSSMGAPISHEGEIAVASLFHSRSDSAFFPGGKSFFHAKDYDKLQKSSSELPLRGKMLGIVEASAGDQRWLQSGAHYTKEDGKEGGFGFRHIYERHFNILQQKGVTDTAAHLMEYIMHAAEAKKSDQPRELPNGRIAFTSLFEYNGAEVAARVILNQASGEVINVSDKGESETRRLWRKFKKLK